jgi:hypothetical protein
MSSEAIRLTMLHASFLHNNVRSNIGLIKQLCLKALKSRPAPAKPACNGSQKKFVQDFVAAWNKVLKAAY